VARFQAQSRRRRHRVGASSYYLKKYAGALVKRRTLALLTRICTCIVIGCGAIVVAAGCGKSGESNHADYQAVRHVAHLWLEALATGDGRTYCALLSPRLRAKEEENARDLVPKRTCDQAQSARPPGLSAKEQQDETLAREQVSNGHRIDRITISGNHATVQDSWLIPAHPSPILSFAGGHRRGNREIDYFPLIKINGKWEIGSIEVNKR
jgi:hypothetical protein